jgi:hypothetical protein
MEQAMFYAPQVRAILKHYSDRYEGCKDITAETMKKIDELFHEMDRFVSLGGDNAHSLWVRAKRGPIEAFGDVEEWIAEEMVSSREEFEEWWREDFPTEEKWFLLSTAEYKGFRTVFLNHKPVISIDPREKHGEWNDLTEFVQWAIDGVRDCIAMVKAGTYVQSVENGVDPRDRSGTVAREDFWRVFPDSKEDYYKDITKEEINEFVTAVSEQGDERFPKPKTRLKEMTANDFYDFCAEGYRANFYEGLEGKTPRQMYDAHADGRDEGLGEIDPDSPEAFHRWYHDRNRGGGHPWEVCRGGNSTHVSLFVRSDERGYYLEVAGKSWGRSIETARFFLALRRKGLPVVVDDGKELVARFLGTDRIGIVPDGIFPRYCDSWFPGEDIVDFMNLPPEKEDREKLIPYVKWHALDDYCVTLACSI